MVKRPLLLPVIQNWSCHNCGGCCREHLIEISAEEKRRIEQQGWSGSDDVPQDRPLIVPLGTGRWRLNHQQDGACVFLNEQGLCRIHGRFGESAKPLACRVYPYAVHPFGAALTVSLRFSCPSVVRNAGSPVAKQSLQKLAAEITAGSRTLTPPPAIHGDQRLDWEDVGRFISALDRSFDDDSVHFAVRLMRVLSWLELVEQSDFETVRGHRLDDYLTLITHASRKAQPDNDLPVLRPSRMGRLMFRMLVAQLLRHDTAETAARGLIGRLSLLGEGLKFTSGIGRLPGIPIPASVAVAFETAASSTRGQARFRDLERPFEGRQPEIDELMVRYFRVKIQGLHFCGAANFDMSLVDGFRALALMYPASLWVARARAAAAGRSALTLEDAQVSLATVDHNFAYSPALGTRAARDRIRILGRMQQVTRLCGWYSL